jgi:lipoprotein NlpI
VLCSRFGNPENAASYYEEALTLAPSDTYAVLWLHIARNRAGQNDLAELAANAAKLDRKEWPWPVVAHYLGSLDAASVDAAAAAPESPQARKEQTCETNFYLGAAPAKGASVEAQRRLRTAVAECPKGFIEYSAAQLELKRLDALATATKQ